VAKTAARVRERSWETESRTYLNLVEGLIRRRGTGERAAAPDIAAAAEPEAAAAADIADPQPPDAGSAAYAGRP
jgi:hypothetical protein